MYINRVRKFDDIFENMKKGSLKRHMRTVHEGRSDFECDECGKRFKSYQSMKVRIGGHTSTPSCISMLFLFLLSDS